MIRNSGNFNGKALKALQEKIEALKNVKVVVGVPASTNGERKDGLSNATIAAAQEFGVPGRVTERMKKIYRGYLWQVNEIRETGESKYKSVRSRDNFIFTLGEIGFAGYKSRLKFGFVIALNNHLSSRSDSKDERLSSY
ncbi:hypothetical protein [Xenorhabdus griffiniae]|uniref:hypothetical protein n=1 Tax=Xenorhabdus griffiniae TaxID=351672 RepID=UPI002358FB4C|nr:hypothetical protein [Xenorhabdus griffiniae]MDC9606617.1 hypothetical protein [Xenorhabdus griffiniae]